MSVRGPVLNNTEAGSPTRSLSLATSAGSLRSTLASKNDTLAGNSGADIFVFNTKLNATTNVDIIEGFEQGTDIIHLDDAIFSKLKNINFSSENIYLINDARDANGKNDFLVYDASTGALSYDADGIGSKAPIQFATLLLGAGQHLSSSDFLII